MSETPELSNDPEIRAEEKKNKIWHLRFERWKEGATAVSFFLQTFKAEAVSLMSGLGTLVVGWYQLRRWVVRGRAEGHPRDRFKNRQESGSGENAGGGAGRREDVLSLTTGELAAPAPELSMYHNLMTDPVNYVTIVLPAVFIWSSIQSWVKRQKKLAERNGGKP